ncbi:MAG: hypothetical protein CMC51_01635 [Flavobacteriaceae bacterium]|nr:hypothetical protein [Flavobacteriaceae bacterium]
MFKPKNTYGSRTKRGVAKLDQKLKAKLKNITQEILDSINVEELTRTQKVQLLKTSLAYLLPKEYINDTYINEDVPLFVDEPPVVIAFDNVEQRKLYDAAT